MIPKLDQKPPIQDTVRSSSPVPTSSVPAQTRRSPKTMRRSCKKGEQRSSSNSPIPPLRRHDSIESCSSIDSMMVIPSAIVTVSTPLHAEDTTSTSRCSSRSSSRSNSPVPAAARVSPSPTPRSTSKAVSFNKRVRIRKIKRLEDMTEEEIEATYFSEQELVYIRNDLRSNIRSMVNSNYRENQHETVDDYERPETAFCVRGLEHEFPQGKFRRKQLKMMSRGAVLEEQRLQRQFCVGRHGPQGEDSINSVSASAKSLNSSSNHSTMTASTCDSTIHSFGPGGYHTINEDADIAISEIYRIESKPAVQLALEFAKRDEAIADQIYFAHQAI